jgi:hypothetical protein
VRWNEEKEQQAPAVLATAPVLTVNSHRKNNSTNSVKFGGLVIVPSTRGSSPGNSSHCFTCTSSPDQVSRNSVDNHTDDSGPTPGRKAQPLDMVFSSELRNKRPQLYLVGKNSHSLRSDESKFFRGHSISSSQILGGSGSIRFVRSPDSGKFTTKASSPFMLFLTLGQLGET